MHRVFETIVKPLFNIEINYIEDRRIGTKTLLARVYRLIGTAPFPGILEVHGGAWISNNLTIATQTQKTIKKRQRQNNQTQRKNLN
jgi:acetyl esterase/lipase